MANSRLALPAANDFLATASTPFCGFHLQLSATWGVGLLQPLAYASKSENLGLAKRLAI